MKYSIDHTTFGAAYASKSNIGPYGISGSSVGGPPASVGAPRRRALKFQKVQQELFASGRYDEAAEKAKLVRQLTAFRDTATALPYLYATIDREYGGNTATYLPTSTPSSKTPPSPTPNA